MTVAPVRTAPEIRDHETLRLIGRGAYGEVWMARSVTGALRAVKVVWREDYDHADSFEREFEAIKRYEPISRRHPGLVPILQVGRSDEQGFYYYVMELADDLATGRDIRPEDYKPHTLGLEMRRDKRIKADRCLKIGANVAEGLQYLHENKLIHRDVKPSNLIFIDGACRLADIGLVALLGQRSFVGTEGFVAPEGPGSPESDIFSLGMVLYEASTGKDRLDFPDIPSCTESGDKLAIWQRLHRVICTACAPKAKDRYNSAHEMTLDLRGQPLPSRRLVWYWAAAGMMTLTLAVGFGMWLAQRQGGLTLEVQKGTPMLTIKTEPEGAEVFAGEDTLGITPLTLNPEEGVPVIYQLRLPGHKQMEIEHIANRSRPAEYDLRLEATRLPQPGERWTNSLGIAFKPAQSGHISAQPIEIKYFKRFLEATGRSFEGKVVRASLTDTGKDASYFVVVPVGDAEAFRFWMTDTDRAAGVLSQEHHYEVEPFYYVESGSGSNEDMPEDRDSEGNLASEEKNWQAFHLRVERQTYGSVVIRTSPEKVRVFQYDEFLGYTPLELPRVRSGLVEYELREEGFSDVVLEGEVKPGALLELFSDMQTRQAVTFGREWKANGLGLRLVPLGEVMIAAVETRRRDYLEFAKATNARRPGNQDADGRGGTQPIVGIDRDEARAFCEWLTERERNAGLIGAKDRYRLPTDEEWSRAVGLPLERGSTPAERNGRIRGIYPWGFDWPPPPNVENLADIHAGRKANMEHFIPGYEDRFPQLAPVGAFAPNERGICALGGNVAEWVDTDFDSSSKTDPKTKKIMGTVRGGSWQTANPDELLSSVRVPMSVDSRRPTVGFRIVLERGK
ncbi:Sulfatase-modifying factor enzyme 1 [Prosthecobacter debontii]|uniref:Sulfatase-modifying factor enzyme 1 n=1 Tax=Prosthecobacter debontii TaxID=48467 RepID=A0A1T4YPG2_9BACT|nr:bifunctional serine/threonine-protein kinase/formylglycine-generating enzyme family protein [Prosthecobacter debontii]SKB03151.1 Sulfatase-modifying factor enzyme 1 [Prosthecobacter debontii]